MSMSPPKTFIIMGNQNYKGWVFIADFETQSAADAYIANYLLDVPWQWALTKCLKLKGYAKDDFMQVEIKKENVTRYETFIVRHQKVERIGRRSGSWSSIISSLVVAPNKTEARKVFKRINPGRTIVGISKDKS